MTAPTFSPDRGGPRSPGDSESRGDTVESTTYPEHFGNTNVAPDRGSPALVEDIMKADAEAAAAQARQDIAAMPNDLGTPEPNTPAEVTSEAANEVRSETPGLYAEGQAVGYVYSEGVDEKVDFGYTVTRVIGSDKYEIANPVGDKGRAIKYVVDAGSLRANAPATPPAPARSARQGWMGRVKQWLKR